MYLYIEFLSVFFHVKLPLLFDIAAIVSDL